MTRVAIFVGILLMLGGCSNEARDIGPAMPQTPPKGDDDPRIPAYQKNAYQMAQGGRYFAWYGCGRCHTEGNIAAPDLASGRWHHGGGFAQVYASITRRHPAQRYQERVPSEQLWQITAYVRDLPTHTPEKRRRLLIDQKGEAQGSSWQGPG